MFQKFRLRAESDEANVETEWRGLLHPNPAEGKFVGFATGFPSIHIDKVFRIF